MKTESRGAPRARAFGRGRTMSRVALLMLLMLAGLSGACEGRAETAEEAFEQYVRHVFLDQDQEAWELVWPPDREAFLTLQQDLEAAGAEGDLEDHETLLVRAIINPYAIKRVEMREVDGQGADTATLKYELMDGRTGTARMRRLEQRWYVAMRR